MEKFAGKLNNALEETLFLFQELKLVFQRERDCIVNIEIDLLWHAIQQKKEIMSKINNLKTQMLHLFNENNIPIDMDIKSFNLSKAIKKIPVLDKRKSDFLKLKSLIETEQEEIKEIAHANSKHVNSYLLVIDDVFSTIMSVADQNQYKKSGSIDSRKKGNCLIRQEV